MTKADGGGDAGVAAECVQDCEHDGDGGSVYGGSGVGDHGAVRPEGADDSGDGGGGRPAAGTGAQVAARTFHFEVLDNRQLTPSAMLVSVYQTLQGTNAAAAEMSYSAERGADADGKLPAEGAKPQVETVKLSGLMAQNEFNSGAINAALFVNDRFSRVYGNAVEQPVITGLRLKMEALPERRTAVLETARLSRMEAHAGETLEVEATLHPYQAEAQVVRFAGEAAGLR